MLKKTSQIIIGFDFGTKKIGIAIGQKITCTAYPLAVVKSKYGVPNWNFIKNIFDIWYPEIAIVGLPLNINGNEQKITILTKNFAKQLKKNFPITVKLHDERFSSCEAKLFQQENIENTYCKIRKNKKDSISAKIILESWLNNSHYL